MSIDSCTWAYCCSKGNGSSVLTIKTQPVSSKNPGYCYGNRESSSCPQGEVIHSEADQENGAKHLVTTVTIGM